MRSSEHVPVISLLEKPERLTASVGEALERIGFFILTDHGLQPGLLAAAYAATEKVFDLPIETKLRYERLPDHQDGYTPYGVEHAKDDPNPDLKEFWHVRASGEALPEEVPEFGEVITYLGRQLSHLGCMMLDHLDAYLGEPSGRMRSWTRDGRTLTRVIHYPEVPSGAEGVRSSAHEDINLITMLVSATAPGLDVKTRDGQWIEVAETPGAIVVNAGDMLQMATGGRIRSATHRVRNLPGRRYSIPHFIHPRSEVVLREEPRLTAGEYLLQRLREIGVL